MAELEDGASQATVERSLDPSGTTVVSIGGEIDMSNVETVEADLASALAGCTDRVVFDVSALGFIDSSGIAVLLRAAEKTGRVELRSPSATIRRILEATGLSDVLHIEP